MNLQQAKKRAVAYLLQELSTAHFDGGSSNPLHAQLYGLKKQYMNKGRIGLHGVDKVMTHLGYEINFTENSK